METKTKYLASEQEQRSQFVQHLLHDLKAMEIMLRDDVFETGVQRMGAEQEFCVIDYSVRPAMKSLEILKSLDDDHFTTELAKFNLELNLDPRYFTGDCFSWLENELIRYLTKANRAAHKVGGKIILTGILPTIRGSDLVIENLTPIPRYKALNDALYAQRGSAFRFNMRGIDELIATHDTVMYEACNTSFQVHYQIDPDDFAAHYNWAQAISAPILAAATFSPMFLGKRLWRETRIALFHQSTDYRRLPSHLRQQRARVTFGRDWEKGTALECYREIVTRYKILLTPRIEENPLELLEQGQIPKLRALAMHNGTIYKWNRPCYGLTDGKPHLRIESRYLPSGPTIVDEVANAAFWLGLMNGRPAEYDNIHERMEFDEVKANFLKAARLGLDAQLTWLGGKTMPAQTLLLDELLPIARSGLEKAGVATEDIDKYICIVEARVETGKTGSTWILDSFTKLRKEASADEAIVAITEGIYQRQKGGHPVHRWELTDIKEGGGWKNRYWYVEQLMSTDLITVQDAELVDLVKNIMLWSNIRHVPVESAEGDLVGLITTELILEHLGTDQKAGEKPLMVRDIMVENPMTVTPTTPTRDALKIMHENEIGCLPVVENGKLVGIFTERDYVKIAKGLFAWD